MKRKTQLEIAGRLIGADAPVYIIGEMACGHQGDITQAKALIDAAVNAGADCVQLQIFDTAANMAPTAPIYSLLEELYFSPEQWREIMNYARDFDIHISIFAYDEPSLALALELKPDLIKLNSSELSNPAMLVGAARSGLPFTAGTGASTLDEIRRAVDITLANGGDKMILMHGVQNFPTPVASANINAIQRLTDEFGGIVGFADHTDANTEMAKWIDLVAIGQGASILEKHMVLDRSKQGVDWEAALEPAEFKTYVTRMREAWRALGPYEQQPFGEGELKYRRFQKKSLVAARDLAAGEVLRDADVLFLRVQGEQEGIAPIDFEAKAEGQALKRALAKYEQILTGDLQSPR